MWSVTHTGKNSGVIQEQSYKSEEKTLWTLSHLTGKSVQNSSVFEFPYPILGQLLFHVCYSSFHHPHGGGIVSMQQFLCKTKLIYSYLLGRLSPLPMVNHVTCITYAFKIGLFTQIVGKILVFLLSGERTSRPLKVQFHI